MSATNQFTVTVREINHRPRPCRNSEPEHQFGTILNLTLSAVDSDLPPNPLTYASCRALLGDDGQHCWPADLESRQRTDPSTNTVQVSVNDNGTPALGMTNQFTVVVTGHPALYGPFGTNDAPGTAASKEFTPKTTRTTSNPAPLPPRRRLLHGRHLSCRIQRTHLALVVASDEAWLNWESSLTLGDKTNRLHPVLDPPR